MNLKRTPTDVKPETDLLIGLITSDRFISEMSVILDCSLLQLRQSRIVAEWALQYYKKYNKSPGRIIQDIYNAEKNNIKEDVAEYIESLLMTISSQYETGKYNDQFLIDASEKYLALRKLEILRDSLTNSILNNDIDSAEMSVITHSRVERPSATAVDVLTDKELLLDALDEERNELMQLSGDIGQMIGPLCRADFFSVLAPMKRGKTWVLEELAIRALLRDLKVLFVSMEMPRQQMIKRLYMNFLGQTKTAREISLPFFDEDGDVCHRTEKKRGLTSSSVLKKGRQLSKMMKTGGMKLLCYPQKSASVTTIMKEIEQQEYYHSWFPDVIVVDYADILASEKYSSREPRHQLDDTWSALRRMAQELNCLVITASQSNRATFSRDATEGDIAEDIRKMAHVTHMMALNQDKEEKQKGIMRMTMLANRNEEFHSDNEVVILYNFSIGKAILDSRWKKNCSY